MFFQLLLICIISPFPPNFFNWERCKSHRNIWNLAFQQAHFNVIVYVYLLICRFVGNRPLCRLRLIFAEALVEFSMLIMITRSKQITARVIRMFRLRLWLPDQLLGNFDRKTAGSVRSERSELMVNMCLVSRWDWMTSEDNNTVMPEWVLRKLILLMISRAWWNCNNDNLENTARTKVADKKPHCDIFDVEFYR